MTSSGIPFDRRWTTRDAIKDIDDLSRCNGPGRKAFYAVARIILNDWRRWDGPGMEVDVAKLKRYIRIKLTELEEELEVPDFLEVADG